MTRCKLWYADNLKKGKAQGVEDRVRFLLSFLLLFFWLHEPDVHRGSFTLTLSRQWWICFSAQSSAASLRTAMSPCKYPPCWAKVNIK